MKIRVAFLACAASLLAATGAEAQVPGGSYQQTCSGSKVAGNTLTAKCRTIAGAMVDTSLPLPCNGPIENINGKLTCKAAAASKRPTVTTPPAGSYKDTCTDLTVANNVLRAKCRTKAGAKVDTSVNLPCKGPIENIDGKLRCGLGGALLN